MGAEFCEKKVKAKSGDFEAAKSAFRELSEEFSSESERTEGYSGTFADTDGLFQLFQATEKEFVDWVVEHGEKRKAYAWDTGQNEWVIAAWAPS